MKRSILLACLCSTLMLVTNTMTSVGNAAERLEKKAAAKDWHQFRGPNRDGVSTETGLLASWPTDGPKLLWEAKGAGRGYSSVVMSEGKLYTMGDGPSTVTDSKEEFVSCFDLSNGKLVWQTKTGPAWNSGQPAWQGSRSTPTLDGDRLYVITPSGVLVALATADGKELWRKDLPKEFSGKKGDGWGYSESPLIDGDKLICTPGGEKATVVALKKMTGDVIWSNASAGDRGAGHASAVISDVGGTRVYVQMTAGGALGIRADDGKILWSYPIERTTAVIPTPIVRGDLVFFSVGYGRGGALLQQEASEDGDGEVTIKEIYPLNRELNNKHGGVLLVGDFVYGDTDATGVPFCAELMTGKVRWKKRGPVGGTASITAAEGMLYMTFASGTMVLAKADPTDFTVVSSFKIPHSGERPSWAHPVVSGGKLYLRENDFVMCYDLTGK